MRITIELPDTNPRWRTIHLLTTYRSTTMTIHLRHKTNFREVIPMMMIIESIHRLMTRHARNRRIQARVETLLRSEN